MMIFCRSLAIASRLWAVDEKRARRARARGLSGWRGFLALASCFHELDVRFVARCLAQRGRLDATQRHFEIYAMHCFDRYKDYIIIEDTEQRSAELCDSSNDTCPLLDAFQEASAQAIEAADASANEVPRTTELTHVSISNPAAQRTCLETALRRRAGYRCPKTRLQVALRRHAGSRLDICLPRTVYRRAGCHGYQLDGSELLDEPGRVHAKTNLRFPGLKQLSALHAQQQKAQR